jgi:hypothetical protein
MNTGCGHPMGCCLAGWPTYYAGVAYHVVMYMVVRPRSYDLRSHSPMYLI